MLKSFYVVEEGFVHPKDKMIAWRPFAQYESRAEAIESAQLVPIARVLECSTIWMTKGVKQP